MSTEHYGFATIQTNQMNWDRDVNTNWGDSDFLFHSQIVPPEGVLRFDEVTGTLPPYTLGRVRDGVYGLPAFEETDNLIPSAESFSPSDWTYTGSPTTAIFDRVMGTKKISIPDGSSDVSVNFTTGSETNHIVSFEGDATLEIYQGATLEETITNSPANITLSASTTYKLKVLGSGKWAAHIQVEPKSHVTPFSTKENKRYDCNLVWNLSKSYKMNFGIRCIPMASSARESGRILWTDAFELFFNSTFSAITLKIGTETTQALYNFLQDQEYLISVAMASDKVRVYVDQVKQIEADGDLSITQFGIHNGIPNVWVTGYAYAPYKGIDNLAYPPAFMLHRPVISPINTSNSYSVRQLDEVIMADVSSAGISIDMTPEAQWPGHEVLIKDASGNAGTNNIVVNPHGDATIDGASSFTISTNYGVVRLCFDGSNWSVV